MLLFKFRRVKNLAKIYLADQTALRNVKRRKLNILCCFASLVDSIFCLSIILLQSYLLFTFCNDRDSVRKDDTKIF